MLYVRSLFPWLRLPAWMENIVQSLLDYIVVTLLLIVVVLCIPILILVSILPSAPLLLAFPSIFPQETVLQVTAQPARNRLVAWLRRITAAVLSIAAMIALALFVVELMRFLPLPQSNPMTSQVAETIAGWKLQSFVPHHALVNWPLLLCLIYGADLVMLIALLRVPMAYNYRNLMVRWWTTLLVALAFTVVICLMIVMLSFVNGMYNLTESTGQKGNVIALADGATDEQFSTVQYSDVTNLEREWTELDENNYRLPANMPKVQVARIQEGDKTTFLCSRETIIYANQPLPFTEIKLPNQGAIRVRGVADPEKLASMSGVELQSGSAWFGKSGQKASGEVEVVCGPVLLRQLAKALGKPDLGVGQTFELAEKQWKITGVMSAPHKQMESEAWVKLDLLSTTLMNLATGSRKRRFLQIRGIVDPPIAEKVHGLEL